MTDAWLAGPVDGVTPELQPVAHALMHARADVERVLAEADVAELFAAPGASAAAAWHLDHLAGSLERLLTYARGETLSRAQLAALAREKEPAAGGDVAALRARVLGALDAALTQVRATDVASLDDVREVGRARLPSSVRGLLFHAAEHSARHAGQALTAMRAARTVRP